jgi:hypothetical protein
MAAMSGPRFCCGFDCIAASPFRDQVGWSIMSNIHWGDIPTWLAAIGTIAAASIAVWIAIRGTRHDNANRAADRKESDAKLANEREYQAKQRVTERYTEVLLKIAELYEQLGGPLVGYREDALLRAYLNVLPDDICTLIRGRYTMPMGDMAKRKYDNLLVNSEDQHAPTDASMIRNEITSDFQRLATGDFGDDLGTG